MTTRRYLNYRRALLLVSALDPITVSDEDRRQLCDAAEALLLDRGDVPETAAGALDGAIEKLAGLEAEGLLSEALAGELRRTLWACGPAEPLTLAFAPSA